MLNIKPVEVREVSWEFLEVSDVYEDINHRMVVQELWVDLNSQEQEVRYKEVG